ncbi:cytochrome c oxidase subunit 7A2-like, mitochondrial [Calliopsis andreniformis]|uniref:cytochrome c oxidase subunit 7A2-like, mitochondrial n=1 Tax=Calliopsis andreniformis TaxID=337506 RepID=UPI003FCDA637
MSFHEFNPFSGRLRRSTQSQSLSPVLPRPLQSAEVPVMIYDTIKTKPVGAKSTQGNYSTLSPKMAELYKKYQADLSKPSYLLAGKRDKIMYAITIALTVATTLANSYYLFSRTK